MLGTLIFASSIAAAIVLLIQAIFANDDARKDAIARRLVLDDDGKRLTAASSDAPTRKLAQNVRRAAKGSVSRLARIAAAITSRGAPKRRAKLARAGLRGESATKMFLASQSILGLATGATVLLSVWSADHRTAVILAALGGVLGFCLPSAWLSRKIHSRGAAIKSGLSDALDLLVIMAESGLGLDAAIRRASVELAFSYPELAQELRITNTETNMGVKRAEALHNFAERTGLKEVKSVVGAIVQAEHFGGSIAKTLRIQAESLRVKRKQVAEEAAQKTAVKLLVPLILFIFPALMVVVGGPAVINLVAHFKDL